MSEPKRYQPVVQCVEPSYQAQMIEPKVMEFSEGEYVLHSDYARLKAECQARQAENSVLAVECDTLKAEVERSNNLARIREKELSRIQIENDLLKAEVERLTKAGDAMAELMFIDKDYIGSPKQEAVVEWCKATEGKQP